MLEVSKQKYTILWVEDDYMDSLHAHLEYQGYELKRAYSVSTAEKILREQGEKCDLIILDLMMDLEQTDLDQGYTAENTAEAYHTGLEFYRRNHGIIKKLNLPVLVYTVIGADEKVRSAFFSLGLPEGQFLDKRRSANVNAVSDTIKRVLKNRAPNSDTWLS